MSSGCFYYVSSSISLRFWFLFQVGDIPQGLPKFSIPKEFGHAKSLISTAMLITGVAILVNYNTKFYHYVNVLKNVSYI